MIVVKQTLLENWICQLMLLANLGNVVLNAFIQTPGLPPTAQKTYVRRNSAIKNIMQKS